MNYGSLGRNWEINGVFSELYIPLGGILSVQAYFKEQYMKDNPDHEANLVALRRIEGQVRGVQRMIESRKYCIDILNQIYAVKGALGRVEEKILRKHFQSCVTEAVKGNSEKEKEQKLDEILKLIHQIRRG